MKNSDRAAAKPRAIELVSENAPVKVRDLKVHKLGTIWAEPDR